MIQTFEQFNESLDSMGLNDLVAMRDNLEEQVSVMQDSIYKKTGIKAMETSEPTKKEGWVQLTFEDRFSEEVIPPVYINFTDFGDTTMEGMLTSTYNLGKIFSKEVTIVEIATWSSADNAWVTFGISGLQKRRRLWHPEWITQPHPFGTEILSHMSR